MLLHRLMVCGGAKDAWAWLKRLLGRTLGTPPPPKILLRPSFRAADEEKHAASVWATGLLVHHAMTDGKMTAASFAAAVMREKNRALRSGQLGPPHPRVQPGDDGIPSDPEVAGPAVQRAVRRDHAGSVMDLLAGGEEALPERLTWNPACPSPPLSSDGSVDRSTAAARLARGSHFGKRCAGGEGRADAGAAERTGGRRRQVIQGGGPGPGAGACLGGVWCCE